MEKYLEKGFPISHLKHLPDVVKLSLNILDTPETHKKQNPELLRSFEDPKDIILETIKEIEEKRKNE